MNRTGSFKVRLPRLMTGAEVNALTKGKSDYPAHIGIKYIFCEENYYRDGSSRWGYAAAGNDKFFKIHRFEEIPFNQVFGKSFKDE